MRSGLGCRTGIQDRVIAMDDFRNSEVLNLGTSFAQLGSDAARRFCEQSQGFACAINEWNTEVGRFFSHRVTRNLDAVTRMTKCGNLQEAFSIQAEWIRDTADDYASEIGKMIEVNGKVVSEAVRPVQEAAVQSAEGVRLASANVPMKVSA